MIKNTLFCLCWLLLPCCLAAQQTLPVTVLDFVRIQAGHRAEALYYYENNWKLYRDTALARGYISAYRLLETTPDSLGNFDLVLVTTYPDSAAQARSEERFRPILGDLRPGGPLLLNGLGPGDFRHNVFFKTCKTLFAAEAKPLRVATAPPDESRVFLQEINRDIWVPFMEAYATYDADKYIALHTTDFIRAQGDEQSLRDLAGYKLRSRAGFQRGKEQGGQTRIDFRFFERFSDGKMASERGIYQYTYTPKEGDAWTGYGRFHVFLRKENGRWKIAVDYDSSDGGTVGEADFRAGKRMEEW